MAISAACVGDVSKAAIHPLNDVAAPIRTSLSSAGTETAEAIVSIAAGTTTFQSTLIFPSCGCDDRGLRCRGRDARLDGAKVLMTLCFSARSVHSIIGA